MAQAQTLDPASFPVQAPASKPAGGLDPSAFPVQGTQESKAKAQAGPATPPVPDPGFFSNLWQSTIGGIPGAIEAFSTNLASEYQQAGLMGLVSPAPFVRGVAKTALTPSMPYVQAALDAWRRGDYGLFAANAIRATPMAGPMGAQIREQIRRGDYMGAAGQFAGLVLPAVAGKAGKLVGPRQPRALVPLTRAERTAKPLTQYAETLTERTLPGAKVYGPLRAEQQAGLQQMGEAAAERIAPGTAGQGAADVGNAIQAGLEQGRQSAKMAVDALYDQVRHLSGDVTVPTASLKAAARPILKSIYQEAKVIPPKELARTTALLERINKAPDRVPFSVYQDVRSDLGKISRSFTDPLPGRAAGVARKLSAVAKDALYEAARTSGVAGLEQVLRTADTMLAENKQIFNDAFIKRLLRDTTSPETIPSLIRHGDVDDLRLLKKAAPADVDAARARVLRDLMKEVTEPPPPISMATLQARAGLTTGGRTPGLDVAQVSGLKLSKVLDALGTDKATELFGVRGVQDLTEIANLAERVNPARIQRLIPGLVAGGINVAIVHPVLHAQRLVAIPESLPMAGVSSGGLYAGFYGLAKILTSQPGRGLYRSFLRSLSQGNRSVALALGTRLTAMIDQAQQDEEASSPSQEKESRPPRTGGGQ